jgi:hypothetical protein
MCRVLNHHTINALHVRFGDTFANEGMLALLRDTNIPMFAQVRRFRQFVFCDVYCTFVFDILLLLLTYRFTIISFNLQTMCASAAAGSMRIMLMPVDAWKTIKQVRSLSQQLEMQPMTSHPAMLIS